MPKLIFATGNKNKYNEAIRLFGEHHEVESLSTIGHFEELEETGDTLLANALQKCRFIYEKYGMNCFSEDTGLEIDALNGEPGVNSARYSGVDKDAEANMAKVLRLMKGQEKRTARFKTVIVLILEGREFIFEGAVEGTILTEKSGSEGFGYDPIFQPKGSDKSFAEFTMEEKNAISHRGRALRKLQNFFNEQAII